MNCLNLHDKAELLPIPMQVVHAITQHITPLPEDIVRKIATLLNKPKWVAQCRQISKKLDKLITEDSEQNRFYWEENMRLRWDAIYGSTVDHFRIIKQDWIPAHSDRMPPIFSKGIPAIIRDYASNYKFEKEALKQLQAFPENPSWNIRTSIRVIAEHYLKTRKASWLYLASKYESQTAFGDAERKDSLQWAEVAASKGHVNAAYKLAHYCIEQNIRQSDPNFNELEKGIHWLRMAAAKNQPDAKAAITTF